MIAQGAKDFSPVYSVWFGKSVVLLVVIRQCRVPLPCRILAESISDVRVLLGPGWELNIRKELILALEADALDLDALVN